MIIAFDLDGTLCEAFYGANEPGFYLTGYDKATRAFRKNCYEHTKALKEAKKFIAKMKKYYHDDIEFAVISTIVSGTEYLQKIEFVKHNFGDFIKPENIYGTVNNEDKIHVLNYLSICNNIVIYFDDSLETIFRIKEELKNKKVIPLHSTSILTKTGKDIDKIIKNEKG